MICRQSDRHANEWWVCQKAFQIFSLKILFPCSGHESIVRQSSFTIWGLDKFPIT